MSQSNQSRAVTILMEALDWPESDRAAFVQRACGGNEALLAEVQSLLDSDARAGDFLGSPTAGSPPATQDITDGPLREGPGTMIGPYKLLHLIGEGGFGSVFMAEQEKPVRRKVALKIIKLGMDTRQVVARFEAERQALAIMDHPNIARVLEAGATQSGRPYFVMELVRGVPITNYCDTNNLPLPERLGLFVQVCRAVQHAHSKGIIHRDLKPSNVMVTMADGKPAPKVIDFGIAKATDQRLAEKTVFTELRQMIGTPEYMSPEQAEMAGIDIDTRSDVYSLGVLLYELLVGSTPFDPKELRSKAYAEMQRIIREVEPERPSTRLSKLETLASVAARRRIEPAKLGQLLKGELDWIVMRAMEKDRTRRYETASALARDVERYLDDEAVEACPPSTGYQLRRLARKYRRPLQAVAAVAAVLVAATAFSSWEAVHASRAQANAVIVASNAKKDRDQALLDKRRADEQSAIARAVNEFLDLDVLGQANPYNQGGASGEAGFGAAPNPDLKVREALDNAAARIAGHFKGQPRVEGAIRSAIGDAYRVIGQYDKADVQLQAALALARASGESGVPMLNSLEDLGLLYNEEGRYPEARLLQEQALDGQRKLLGPDDPSTLNSMHNLAVVYESLGRYPEAEALLKQSLDGRRRTLGEANPETLHSLTTLAAFYMNLDREAEAEPMLNRAVEGQRKALGAEHPVTLYSLSFLSLLYESQGHYQEAESIAKHVAAGLAKALGDANPTTLRAVLDLAGVYTAEGRYSEAEPLYKQTRDVLRRTFDESYPTVLDLLFNFARFYELQGRPTDAEAMCEQALNGQRKRFGNGNIKTLNSLAMLSVIYLEEGRFPESKLLCKEAFEGYRRVVGSENPTTLDCLMNLASLDVVDGRYSDAEAMFKKLLIAIRRVRGDSHPSTLTCLANLANVYREEGRPSDAEPLYKQALDGFRRTLGEAHPTTLKTLSELAITYQDEARYPEAEALLKQALKEGRSKLGQTHPDTLRYMANLANVYSYQERYAEAEALCEEALKGRRATLGPKHPDTLESSASLATLYFLQGRYAQAESMLKQVLEARRRLLGDANPATFDSMSNLARLYVQQDRNADAEPLYRQALEGRRKWLGETHPQTLMSLSLLGHLYLNQARYALAEPMLKQALDGFRKIPGAIRPQTKYCLDDLGVLYTRQNRFAEAEPLFKQAMELFRTSLGEKHLDTLRCLYHYANLRGEEGRWAEAESMCKQTLEGRRKALGDANSETLNSVLMLALIYREEGRFSDANPLFRELLDGRRKTEGNAHRLTLAAMALLVQNDRQIGRDPEAEALFKEWAETTVANDTSKLAAKDLSPAEASKALIERGMTLVRLGNFRAGEADFAKILALDATDHWPWYYRGCLLAYVKDEDAYRSHCKAMLEKFGGSEDKYILDRTAKTCLLLPAGGDPKQLMGIAEQAWAQAGTDTNLQAWFALGRSLALYRGADFPGCAEWAARCKTAVAESAEPSRTAAAELLIAMANERLRHHPEAIAALSSAEAIIGKFPQAGKSDLDGGNLGIENWLICQVLLREARSMLLDADRSTGPTSRPSSSARG